MNKVSAHITISNIPLCQRQGLVAGLLNKASSGITCGAISLAEAHRIKRKLQPFWHSVKVVRGECPIK